MATKIPTNKTALVLWKHLIIRKRHWILTIVEVCLPILLFLLLAYVRAEVDTVKKQNETETIHQSEPLENIDTMHSKLLFAPRNRYTEDLIQKVQEIIQLPTSNVFDFEDENELINYYSRNNDDTVFGIIFHSTDKKLSYTLRFHEKGISWRNDDLFDSHIYKEQSSIYRLTRFLTLQNAIDMAFIEKESNKTVPNLIDMKPIPFPPRIEDGGLSQYYGNLLPHITIFSFLFVIPAVVQRVVEEKKSGIKELQKMVGLKDWMLWLGWFVHGILPNIVSIVTIVILMKVPFWGAEYPPIEYTNGIIYFIFLFLYAITTITFCFFMSTVTSKPTFSMVFALLVWIFSYFIPSAVIEAYGSTRLIKFAFWMFPNVVLDQGYKIMQVFEQNEIGIQWSNMCELPLSNVKSLKMGEILLLFILQVVFYIVLTVYLDNINPGIYGIKQSPFFFVRKFKKMFRKSEVSDDIRLVEEANLLKPGIQLINLSKNFGAHKAVDNLSLDIYKDQITALLGHNGAGKTTVMHMMTGMIDSSGGTVFINNKNVKTDMDEIRKSLGLCPQHNLLFQDFTVMEHLVFFGMLKGNARKSAELEANSLLHKLNIYEKKNVLASTLSGGMKRKLCLGMALIGNPKVLILDEPTSGMDPESRRAVWDLLLKSRGSKTILITTHFLEEADVLGDWIAIMSHGKVLCHGSPLELKKQFHTGYHLVLSLSYEDQTEKEHLQEKIRNIIKEHVSEVKELKSYGKTVSFNLKIDDKEHFPDILNSLESQKEQLKIENYSLQLTTLEDVFLKTMRHEHHHEVEQDGDFTINIKYEHRYSFFPMIKKRFHCWLRRKWFYVVTLFLVALLLFANSALCQNYLFGTQYNTETNLSLNLKTYGKTSVFLNDNKNNFFGNITEAYKSFVEAGGSKPVVVEDVDRSILEAAANNLEYYKKKIVAGIELKNEENVYLFYSYSALHSAPISMNIFSNALIKTYLGNDYSIEISSWPLTPVEKVGEKPKMVSESQILIVWTALFPIGIILLLCPFIIFPFEELSSKFTSIEFMAGIKPVWYWFTNLFSDSSILLLQIVGILLTQTFQFTLDFNIFYTKEIFFVFAEILIVITITSLPYVYMFSRRKTLSGGVALFIILNLFMGIIPFLIVAVLQTFGSSFWKDFGNFLDVSLLILCPSYGFTKFGNYFAQQMTRKYNWNEMTIEERKLQCFLHQDNPCCRKDVDACAKYTSFFHAPDNTFIKDQCLMLIGMILYLLINAIIDSNLPNILWHQIKLRYKPDVDGNDMQLTENNHEGYNFKATLLKKSYNKVVVNIKSIFVPKGKCYGFLGVNGAGKTTTFNLITKQILNDNPRGKLAIGNQTNNNNYLTKLGYCPQADLLNFTLTGKELLTFIAEIRGVKDVPQVVDKFIEMFDLKEHQDKMVKTYSGGNKRKVCIAIAFLGIQDVVLLDEPTSGVDVGSKRNFWKILKNFQYNNNLTTLLTSHSMNECEALCDRLLIMKDAKIKKNETISRLKQEISGYTINLKLKVNKNFDEVDGRTNNKLFKRKNKNYDVVDDGGSTDENKRLVDLKENILNRFQGNCEITDEHIGSIQYHVKSDKLSKLFRDVEEIKSQFEDVVEDYTISESSVEDIFLKVARESD